ncbi:GCN5 family acetyltransferase [Haloprofundus marisrubri]|uniref:GCN5 family acetyltransferase n=1 Tax=Haloprofundus marisrubri TaxID=1514971 RepID=A0A0W1R8T9_9EURY|nr:GNAT family N-acetyltransferase [Haloprofundus marisrubri]KTG09864.1 GCN5 family acetyltransferase [Haloprofundus marisrubri]
MDLRDAEPADAEGIRTVARESLLASYSPELSEDVIDEAVGNWYDDDEIGSNLEDPHAVWTVAVDGDEVLGFSQSYLVEADETVGQIDWLHVDPDSRGKGLGEQLLKRAETELMDRGASRLEGKVLTVNEGGAKFYEGAGYDAGETREVEVSGEQFTERAFVKAASESTEEFVPVEEREGPDGQTLFVAYDESQRARKAPFYVSYTDEDRENRYGFFCGNCESFATAMDSMERIQCNECGNQSKSARWDAAYL